MVVYLFVCLTNPLHPIYPIYTHYHYKKAKLMAGTVLVSLPVLRALGHRYGLVGVWLSLVFVQGMRAIGFAWRLYKVSRRR